ncbi:MAG: tRNA epoxyqueuosine(34) reductase QueG [Anaerolineae bacterium UTCFX2]|jgi:epoxyqueuosine reductase|nr:MAG: tRNA epoxyqueuosine(34) reductase QueG [Anaerolineae bacterium UTCFX2]
MMKDSRQLRRAIEIEARRLGFELFGVTTAEPPAHFGVFQRWVAQGLHGQMGYLASERSFERRSDPRRILPECRSILALGIRYPAPLSGRTPPPNAASSGRVSAYAWGDDYHDVLAERLAALADFIERQVGEPVPNRWYTDSGPLLERELAQRAGLGWIGKNSCLINPAHGSYFLLAEMLLGLELEPDRVLITDYCGTCTRCLEACPTACILPDRTIDARRCISYLTIELKGAVEAELRPQLGEWVFGCDICQQVCPWNVRFARPQGDPAFDPRPGVPEPELQQELALQPEAFSRKFKRNPVKRARRAGYLRNVALALGNQPDPRSVPVLKSALLSEPEPLVRQHAAWALGRIADAEARAALKEARSNEADPAVLDEIRAALGRSGAAPEA